MVKSTLKIPPRHNGIVPIKIKGHPITGHIACFISDQESTKGKYPNINIVNGIHNIKGVTSVNILVSNYSNKHATFNKGEYVGHLEPTIENIDKEKNLHLQANPDTHTTNSITTKNNVRTSKTRWLWATMPQTQTKHWGQTWSIIEEVCISMCTRWNFHQYDTSNKNAHWHRNFWTSIIEALSDCHEALSMGKRWNREATYSKSDMRKLIQLVSTYYSCTKRRWRETLSNWLPSSQKGNKEVHLAYA